MTNVYQYLFTFENPSGYDWRLGPYVNNDSKDTFTLFGGDISYNNTTPLFCVDSSGNVGIGTNTPSYTLDVSGTISVSMDKDVLSYFGRTAIGNSSYSDAMCISHIDYDSSSNYAILQNSNGATYLNSALDQNMYFSINNDEKMIIDASGNVGIGTSTPNSILDVYTSFTGANSGLYSGRIYGNDSQIGETGIRICELGSDLSANDTYPLSVLANDNYVMNVTAQGNVGIGTYSPNNKLEVPVSSIYDGICTSNSGLKMVLSIDTNNNLASTIQTFTNVKNETPDASSNFGILALNPLGGPVGIGLSNPSSSYALEVNGIINCNNDLYIGSSGKIGVGTLTPNSMLNLKLSNSDNGLRIDNSSGNERITAYTNTSDNAYLQLYNSTNSSNILLDTNGDSYLKGGNVGIGTSTPGYTLDVNGTINCNTLQIQGGAPTFSQWTTSTSNNTQIYYNIGNVGIGTTSPSQMLHVSGGNIIAYSNTEGVELAEHEIKMTNSGAAHYSIFNDGSFKVNNTSSTNNTGTVGTNLFTITSSGNVGIGTSSPSQMLEVSGSSGYIIQCYFRFPS